MASIIVADTGPLIAFAYLELFAIFPNVLGTVLVPDIVLSELEFDPLKPDAACVQHAIEKNWLTIESINSLSVNEFPASLGAGEQAAIHLASIKQCPVLLDDKLARQYAVQQGLDIVGTAGVLIKAKQLGEIGEVMPLLEELRSNGYYLSRALFDKVKEIAKE